MASGGHNRKAPGSQQGHRKPPVQLVTARQTAPAVVTVPDPPTGLLKSTIARWETFWKSEIAGATVETDRAALVRYFRAVDEHERVSKVFRKDRVVDGSTGQPVLNPLGKYLQQLNRELSQLEAAFGLTPLARARLGLVAGQAKLTAAALLESLDLDDEDEADTSALEGTWENV